MSLETIIEDVKKFLGLIKSDAEVALSDANKFVSAVLTFAATPEGQTIESIVEAFIPSDLVNAAKLWLPELFTALNWATAEVGKSNGQIINDGLTYLASTTGNVKASQANTLAANVASFISDNTGAGLTIQQTLATAQPVHAPLAA